MDYYLDLQLQADPDFPAPILMGALYGKLHRALYDLAANDIGVSWPNHKTGVRARTPGNRLRVHGTKTRLDTLMGMPWLAAMRDHLSVGALQTVPTDTQHCVVSRRQFNTGNPSRVRRYAKRHDMPEVEAQSRLATPAKRQIALPFIQVASRSTGERFPIFIEHGPAQPASVTGTFNPYGLSSKATVPWF